MGEGLFLLPRSGSLAPPPPGCCPSHGDIRRGGAHGGGVSQAHPAPRAVLLGGRGRPPRSPRYACSLPGEQWRHFLAVGGASTPCHPDGYPITSPRPATSTGPHWFPPAATPRRRPLLRAHHPGSARHGTRCLGQSPKPSPATQPSSLTIPGTSTQRRVAHLSEAQASPPPSGPRHLYSHAQLG